MNSLLQSNNILLYPLTHPQKRIWYIEKIYPNTSINNIGGSIRIKGKIDFSLLEKSINLLIRKNEGLRIRIIEQNGDVNQYVSEYEEVKLDFKDFSKFKEPEIEFMNWVNEVAKKSFVLENERLFYFALFKVTENDNGYLVKFHHIISDGWSINIMTEQICNTYLKLLNGEENEDESEYSYMKYISQEQKYISSDRFLKNKSFWNEKFKALPEAFLSKSSDEIAGKRRTFKLSPEISSEIKRFAKNNKFSLNTFFVTLYLLYLNKTTHQNDLVIGTPVLNRSGHLEKNMFGMFTSTMPLRFYVNDDDTLLNTLIKVNDELITCYFNQKYPYNLLLQDLELKKNGYDSLFNICVNYYNTNLNSELNGLLIENVEFHNSNQFYSLQLIIKDWSLSGSLILDFDYKVNDYTDKQIDNICICLSNLITEIISYPYREIRNVSLLSKDDKEQLLNIFNNTQADYPKDKSIYQLFEEQVIRTPNKVALSFNKKEVTYQELNGKANQLARFLIGKGIKAGKIVGLLTYHSIETVIGILGILKAGGAYLPIDPSYPKDRINYMLEDSGVNILLTNYELSDGITFKGDIVKLNNVNLYVGDMTNPGIVNNQNDLVYIIYTSGSTGEPKGTMVEHQGLVNYIWWAKKMYIKDEDEIFPLYSSLAFDLTVTSVFTPIICGGRIIIYQDNEDEYVLYRILKGKKATIIKLTPSHLSLLKNMDNKMSSVKRFIVGGEDLKVSLARSIFESFEGNIEIFNEYGPTETVVGCMIYKYSIEKDIKTSVPIGIPANNTQIYILDKNLNPVPVNTVGEIYISGDGVARGYLNKLELTKEKFIDNPFIKGKRMYKTGDLARFLNNNEIEYAGRIDSQVKIRGYRIELGEIEKCLLIHKAIKDAVVIDRKNKDNSSFLCAYIVKKADVSIGELRDFLLGYLPDYMVPFYFVTIEEIPLTSNGKVNRKLLPELDLESFENSEFVGFRNEKEEVLLKTINEVLNIERLDIKQNFFKIGGDSIKAIQITSRLNDKGYKLKVKDMLLHPVIEEMALCIEKSNNAIVTDELCEGAIKQTPIISWYFSQKFSNENHYNQSVLLEIKQNIEVEKFVVVFSEMIKHHDSLRINYNYEKDELFYNNIHLSEHFNINEYELSDLSHDEQCIRMSQIAANLKENFDIERDILIKACLFNLGQSGRRLLITAHHLLVDGVSWRIILDDINTLLRQVNEGQEMVLPAKTNSFQKWAEMLRTYNNDDLYKEKEYWERILKKEFNFPIDYNLGEDTVESSCTLSAQLADEKTRELLSGANYAYNTEPKDLLIASLLVTINEVTGNEEVIIELESHGREDIFEGVDITRTLGWFTSIYPVNACISSCDLSSKIKSVKELLRNVPKNGIGFGILKYLFNSLNRDIKSKVRFNFLGDLNITYGCEYFELLNEDVGGNYDKKNHLTSLIDINCFVINSKLNILLTYSTNKFAAKTMKDFISRYIKNLEKIIVHCIEKEVVEFTPSDFSTIELSQNELDSIFN